MAGQFVLFALATFLATTLIPPAAADGTLAYVNFESTLKVEGLKFFPDHKLQDFQLAGAMIKRNGTQIFSDRHDYFDQKFNITGDHIAGGKDVVVQCHLLGGPGLPGAIYNFYDKKNYLDIFGITGDTKKGMDPLIMTCTPESLEDYANCLKKHGKDAATKDCKFTDYD